MMFTRFFALIGFGIVLAGCSGRLDVGDQEELARAGGATARAPSVVALGTGHACAVLEDTTVACWGVNRYGQTGVEPQDSLVSTSDSPYIAVPARVPGLRDVVQISAGWQSTYALRADGKVFAWGSTSWTSGAMGVTERVVPEEVPGVSEVIKIEDGGGPVCALHRDGTVTCWGSNVYKNVGPSTTEGEGLSPFEVLAPTPVAGITDAIDITVGGSMTCVIHRGGDVSCWGRVQIVADDNQRDSPVPVRIPGVHKVVQVAIAASAAIALLEDGTVMGWGDSDDQTLILGQIHGARDPRVTSYDHAVPPAVFPGLTGIASVKAEYRTMCALVAADGSVHCWGRNDVGELGQGRTTTPTSEPTRVEGVIATQLEVGTWNSCFIDEERRVVCWGNGGRGELGTGKEEKYANKASAPVLLPAPLARNIAAPL